MNITDKNLYKNDYKYFASGGSKRVFKRKPGFIPTLKTGGQKHPEKRDYVSAFFFLWEDYKDEMGALENMRLVDPLEIFTIQPVEVKEKVEFSLLEHLMAQLPEESKTEGPFIAEIIFPFGGVNYEAELIHRKNCSLREFLYPILFLIFCVGYMNDLGYFHRDIQNNNILFNDAQLFLIDFSDLTKDWKTDHFLDIKFVEYQKPEDVLFLGLNLPAETTLLNYLTGIGFSKDLKDQAKRYKDADFTLKDVLKQVNKYYPEIVKESIFYLKQLKNLGRLSPERCRLDHEFRELLIKRLLLRNQIYLQCFEKHKDPNGEIEMSDTVKKCLEPALNTVQDIRLLYADRNESYRLGMTILEWIITFRNKFYKDLVERDKQIFESFALCVYEHLLVFNVIFRMNLSNFHKHLLKQLRFLGYKDFLQEYKHYCRKIYNKNKNATAKPDSDKIKESVESERQYFKNNMFSFLGSLID